MDIAVQESSVFRFSSLEEIYSSRNSVKGQEETFKRESVNFEISQESRLLARINPESSMIKFDFSLNGIFEENSTELFREVSEDPEINKLLPFLDYISEMTGRDVKKEFMEGLKSLSKKLSGNDNDKRLERLTGDIARARETNTEISMSLHFEMRTGRTTLEVEGASSDPLVLDLDGDGIETTGIKDGIEFDINADGIIDKTAFATGGDGVLALDRDGDGKITSGSELFGDQNGAKDGFAELAKFDSNKDRVINNKDSVFNNLKIAIVTDDGEIDLNSLDEMGIEEIYLDNKKTADSYSNGNYIKEISNFKRTDGTLGNMGELYFRYASVLDY